MTMQWNWTDIGKEYVGSKDRPATETSKPRWTQETVKAAIRNITWHDVPTDGTVVSLPMMPGEGIKSMIKEFHIPKVSRVGYAHDLAPYGLLAVEGNYANGTAQIYAVDSGTELIPLVTTLTPKTGVVEQKASTQPSRAGSRGRPRKVARPRLTR